MRVVHFKVLGEPVPQGSKTCFCRGGTPTMFESNKKWGPWRTKCAQAARGIEVTWTRSSPLYVVLTFMFPAIATQRDGWKITAPDIDKLTRAVLDGITFDARGRGVLPDDAQVVRLVVEKIYGDEPGVSITVFDAPSAYVALPLPQ